MNIHQSTSSHQLTEEMQQCIEICLECHRSCLTTVHHCLHLGGEHAAADHITTLLDCAEICQTSANFMLLMSPLHGQVCSVCAEACERCAQQCESMADGDQVLLSCAEVCRRCAESCRNMAAMAV